jgi:ATP/maltotriose-dependent transcriptional regulator MalT
MAEFATSAIGKPGLEGALLFAQAWTEAFYGRFNNARALTKRAMDSARRNDAQEAAALYQVSAALVEVEAGNRKEAYAEARAALKLAPGRDVRQLAALVFAHTADIGASEKIATELDKAYPLDSMVQGYWLPSIRAAIALQRKDHRRTLELLKTASGTELSGGVQAPLYPAFLRGKAYLAMGDGQRAATEFRKLVENRGLVGNFPLGALARLGLARAYALQANPAEAKTAYQDFLALWKNADSDIPILRQAKAEYAKLQ